MLDKNPEVEIAGLLTGQPSQELPLVDYHLMLNPSGQKLTNVPYRTTFYAMSVINRKIT
jgi:hypothetical protein